MILSTGLRRNEPEEKERGGGVEGVRGGGVEGVRAEVIDRGLFEGCCRLLAGQEQLEQHQNCSISNNPSPQVWRGQTEILPITENEVSTPPTIVKGAT